jgi:hypothetical protein
MASLWREAIIRCLPPGLISVASLDSRTERTDVEKDRRDTLELEHPLLSELGAMRDVQRRGPQSLHPCRTLSGDDSGTIR